MSHTADFEGSEDVNDFLKRIRELGDKRDKEDEERTRKLEEEIIQGRKERQARRAERARSISPTKDSPSFSGSPASTFSRMDTPTRSSVSSPPKDFGSDSIRSSTQSLHDAAARASSSFSKSTRDEEIESITSPTSDLPKPTMKPLTFSKPSSGSAMPSRPGTLSWQQRPTSRGSASSRSRPLSLVAAENNANRSPQVGPGHTSDESVELSRDQIAESLGSKDPSWFRQTPDRGVGSAALRKDLGNTDSSTMQTTGSKRLPGMADQDQNRDSLHGSTHHSVSPSRTDPARNSSHDIGTRSPMPTTPAQTFEPPTSEASDAAESASQARAIAMSPTQERILGDRPSSPTKGIGGFVQSAMMKRDDSVKKRWSSQAKPGLKRGDSMSSRDPSPSKPASSQGQASGSNDVHPPSSTAKNDAVSSDWFKSPAHSSKDSHSSFHAQEKDSGHHSHDSSLSTSPSKTMDPRRWSPTKSSWLESALKKPESPKTSKPPPPQPSWMAEIQKAKQQRQSADLGKATVSKETTAEAPSKPSTGPRKSRSRTKSIAALQDMFESHKQDPPSKPSLESNGRKLPAVPSSKPEEQKKPKSPELSDDKTLGKVGGVPEKPNDRQESHPAMVDPVKKNSTVVPDLKAAPLKVDTKGKTDIDLHPSPASGKPLTPDLNRVASPSFVKPLDSPRSRDFRSSLKSRPSPSEKPEQELEFKNVFGRLRRTRTENYVAPNEFKDNILRGKAALNITGGPKKSERKDEFRESLILQKEVNKHNSMDAPWKRTHSPNTSQGSAVPEALARRNTLKASSDSLGSSNGSKNDESSDSPISEIASATAVAVAVAASSTKPVLAKVNSPAKPTLLNKPTSSQSESPKTSPTEPVPKPLQAKPSQSDITTKREPTTSDIPKKLPGVIAPAPLFPKTNPKPNVIEKQLPQSDIPKKPITGGNKLANRFNPALASLIARGPVSGGGISSRTSASNGHSSGDSEVSNRELTHLTKGRARGPKRRLPKTQAAEEIPQGPTSPSPTTSPVLSLPSGKMTLGPRALPPLPDANTDSAIPEDKISSEAGPRPPSIPQPEPKAVEKSKFAPSPVTTPTTPATDSTFSAKSVLLSKPVTLEKAVTPVSKEDAKVGSSTLQERVEAEKPKPPVSPKPSELRETTSRASDAEKVQSMTTLRAVKYEGRIVNEIPQSTPSKTKENETDQKVKDQKPEIQKPVVQMSDVQRPEVQKPEVRKPQIQKPEIQKPDVQKAESQKTDVHTAEVQKPEVQKTEVQKSDAPKPEVQKPVEKLSSSVKNAAATWGKSPDLKSQNFAKPLPQRPSVKAIESADDQSRPPPPPKDSPIGLGLKSLPLLPKQSDVTVSAVPIPTIKRTSAKTPPLPAKKPESISRIVSHGDISPYPAQPPPPETEASRILTGFFLNMKAGNNADVQLDTQGVISSRVDAPDKIRTIKNQIWEVTGDGKQISVPSHQEHILYDQCMYLCTHVFDVPNGSKMTEVYLWCGSAVSEPAIEDAQLFGKKVARDNNTKLIILRQGKESANFFQALGGIVITRQGSSSRHNSSTMYMLCGRRHLGQIAFDEVDLVTESLCSGFPFIVSSAGGKLFLWQGKGSAADEIGCARLIGMDLGLTGELEEVQEGQEPKAFFEAFADHSTRPVPSASTDYWHLKANCDQYCSRLFSIEYDHRPRSAASFTTSFWSRRMTPPANDGKIQARVTEITPFCQADLLEDSIFVLDAFFEIYIIVGPKASEKSVEFRIAIRFAQEYGILSASLEDRPFVPIGTVVFDGSATRDMKAVFRKWDNKRDNNEPAKVISLAAAVEAIGDQA